MKVFKWNIDKNSGGYKINKAKTTKFITYETLSGEIVRESAKKIRQQPMYEVCFGRVVKKTDSY